MTLVAGIVIIAWFIRDVRKQNSKELKNQSGILLQIQNSNEAIQKSLEVQTKILEKIEAKS
ncbi:MAG: hypothetical protein IIA88_09720 [Bacteroidetes bacterium]|nr:hypothetical protein [Bacteroidota bacterium]